MRVAQWGLARKRTGQLARRAAPQQGDCRSAGLMAQSPFRDLRNSDALLNAERRHRIDNDTIGDTAPSACRARSS